MIPVAVGLGMYAAQDGATYPGDGVAALTTALPFSATTVSAVMVAGLAVFSAVFAVNSAVHSYLIVSYSDKDKVSMDLGFYYMGNAGGRLVGTLASGFLYEATFARFGLSACLWASAAFLACSALAAARLTPKEEGPTKQKAAAVMDAEQQIELADADAGAGGDGGDVAVADVRVAVQ